MNGRMYDTDLRRFLSPDNYVQDPTNTQNYNRYQYGYNNPLKYSDPSGEFFGLSILLSGLIIGALVGGTSYAVKAAVTGHWKWGGFLGSIAIGAVSGLYGGAAYKAMEGVVSVGGFLGGAIKGAVSGFVGGFVGGAGNAVMNKKNIVKGAFSGALTGAAVGGLLGGVGEGLRAMKHGGNFWNGDGMTVDVVNYYEIKDPEDIKVNNPIEATDENLSRYVKDKFPNADLKAIKTLSTEHVPSEIGLDGINHLGVTRATLLYRAAGHEWSFSGFSEVYIHSNAFNNSETLFNTIAHEMVHVSQNLALSGTVYNESLANVYQILKEANAYDFTCKSFKFDCSAFDVLYRPLGGEPGDGIRLFLQYSKKYSDLSKLLNWRRYNWTRYFRR